MQQPAKAAHATLTVYLNDQVRTVELRGKRLKQVLSALAHSHETSKGQLSYETQKHMASLLRQGWTITAIAAAFDVSYSTVYNALRRNFELRPSPRYSAEYKANVLAELEGGLSVAEIAAQHGISKGTIYNWRSRKEEYETRT